MKHTFTEHIQNGTWLAGALTLSLLGVVAMVRGGMLILQPAPPDTHQLLLGGGMLALGVVATLSTVHVSYRLLTGFCVIGVIKMVFLLLVELFSKNARYPPPSSLALAILSCMLFVWFALRVEGKQFTVLDRIAATFAPLLMFRSSNAGQTVLAIAIQLTSALVLLVTAGITQHKHLPATSKWLLR